ncbi:formate dehydrogenase accessory protein FdhE [Desulfosporosinus sp. FKB]|uniref:formate dehydrogenase accessory protein FdhE domain-containing protein n=1 Tax=Desulfosporosinus sp. FKB TaxID=1969835 RepID=UPI000B49A10B|nr:formate dehydrogenase accessory protein FdhE [Desulfosporosinus sp. FKB]
MNKPKETLDTAEENNLEEAYQTYRLLKGEIKVWQEERGAFWAKKLNPEKSPPYYPLVNLPGAAILELWARLNRVMEEDVPESFLKYVWQNFKEGRGIQEPWLQSTLQLALSGLAQLARLKVISQAEDQNFMKENEEKQGIDTCCPICGEKAVLSVLVPPHGKRLLHCIFCGQEWPTMRVGCILCGREEASSQNYLLSKEYPGVELVTCDLCGQFFKEFDLRLLSAVDLVWEDVRTLPLNYAGQQWITEHMQFTNSQ